MIVIVYFVVIAVAFFFLIVRPQRQRMAAHRELVAAVGVGDEIITTGGVYGTVRAMDDDSVRLEVAPGTVIRLARGAISRRLTPELADGTDAG